MKFTAIHAVLRPNRRQPLQLIIKVMKLTTLLLIIALVQASAKGFAQKINLNETNAPLEKVINTIKQQSGYVFLYTDQELKNEKITVKVNNASIDETLKAAFKNTMVDYKIVGNNILLKKSEPSNIGQAKVFFAQVTVSGKVVDESGQPLPSVTVRIKNTTQATSTDVNGSYTITVPDANTILIFSFIGYETVELAAKDIANGSTIALKAVNTKLQEVVVNKGYYTERKELSTGNVSSVAAKEISQQPVSDPIQALEGRVAGLYIQQTSGIPGAGSIVRLRGQNSIINGNDPLYIVDGITFPSIAVTNSSIVNGALGTPGNTPGAGTPTGKQTAGGLSPFNSLNPQDIESVEVLKDADATAIYGSRGANGVILITTKKGKIGPTRVDMNFNSGVGQVTRKMDLLNTQQYLTMRRQAFKNDGRLPATTDYDINGTWDTTRYTDWQKELIGKTSHFTNANASISGGNINTQFLFGEGYSKQTTVFPGDFSDEKATFHFSLNHVSTNGKFHMSFSGQYDYDKNIPPALDLTARALYLAPNSPTLYNTDGNINWQGGTWTNPVAALLTIPKIVSNSITGHFNISYEILPGLQVKGGIGYTRIASSQDVQGPGTTVFTPGANTRFHQVSNNYLNTYSVEPQISYTKSIGKGKLDVLAGLTDEQNHRNSLGITATGYATDAQIPNLLAASSATLLSNTDGQYHYSAIYGRIGYNWEEKYLLNITGRRDGSSRFGPSKQFGNFGAIGAGWIFSKEKFVSSNLSFLSFGKIRASYGTSGNDQIADYQYLSLYGFNTGTPYQGVNTVFPTNIGNPYFAWEVVKKLEVGMEFGLLNDRIQLNVDYYRNRTGNQLVGQPLPSITGFTTIQANLPAIVQNKGIEIVLTTVNIKKQNFSWTSSVNLTVPKNTLLNFPDLATNSAYVNAFSVGTSIFTPKLYHYTGLDAQTGIYTFEDVNHDGKLDQTDRQFLKEVSQQYYGGFQNNITYKNWQLDVLVQFVKQTGYNYLSIFGSPGFFNGSIQNQPTVVLNAWSAPGSSSDIEKYVANSASTAVSAYTNKAIIVAAISDASFIRLKNVSLSYQLPTKWQQFLRLRNTRLYVQAQNLLTVTNYSGLDPETQGKTLPPLRMIITGIQIGL
jgi:TonB-linked SusC/RagA family outer membrane protein